MITLDAKQKAAFQSGTFMPVVHVTVQDAAASVSIIGHNVPDGSILDSTITGTAIVSNVQGISQEINPVTREYETDQFTFTFCVDDAFKELSSSKQWLGGTVTFKLGHPDLTFSRYLTLFSGYVSEIKFFENYIDIEALSFSGKLTKEYNLRTFVDEHPSTVLRQLMIDSGTPSSDIDTTTFAADAFSNISHYAFASRGAEFGGDWYDNDDSSDVTQLDIVNTHSNSPYDPPGWTPLDFKNAWKINPQAFADDYLKMGTLSLVWDPSNGEFKLIQYNVAAAVQRHLTQDDYIDFEYEETIGPYNRIEIQVGSFDSTEKLVKQDNTSITTFGGTFALKEGTKYMAAASLFTSSEGTSDSWSIVHPDRVYLGNSFAGTRDLHLGGSQPASAKISADNPFFGLWRGEIIKATSPHDVVGGANQWVLTTNAEGVLDGSYTQSFEAFQLDGVASRPFAGNSGSDSDQDPRAIIDITAATFYADYALTRFSNSCPIIKFMTGLDHVDLELGDTISIDNDYFFCPGLKLTGLDSNVKFEIISKEIMALGDTVGIEFKAGYKTKTSAPSTSIAIVAPPAQRNWPMKAGQGFGMVGNYTTQAGVGTGLDVSAGSGLVANIAKGVANCGGVVRNFSAVGAITMTASKDNYVGVDGLTGRVVVKAVTIGDPPPQRGLTEIRLGMVTTNASAITATADIRDLGSVSVKQINVSAIPLSDSNHAFNPSFEIWTNTGMAPDGWSSEGGVTGTDYRIEASVTHRGRYALALLNTSTVTNLQSKKVPVQPGQPIRGSVWARRSAGNPTIKWSAYWYKADGSAATGTVSHFGSTTLSATGAWENFTGVQTAPADAAYMALRIGRAASPGGILYYDDVTIKPEPISFSVYGAATTAPGTKSAFQVKFDNETHDYGANYDASSDYDFTAPTAGTYEFCAAVQGVYVGAFTYLTLMIYKNGSVLKEGYGGNRSVGTLEGFSTVETGPVELAKGDLITVYMHPEIQTSFTLNTGASQTYFSGRQLS